MPKPMTWEQMSSEYCKRQESTPVELLQNLRERVLQYAPDGFMLLECQQFDSSRFGNLVILPYGPRNTFKTVPAFPISPRGLASDMSIVVGVLPADQLP